MFGLYNAYTEDIIPLKHIDINVECKGHLALIKQTQFYHNPTDMKIETVYCFPKALLDCFYGMEIVVEGNRVATQIKEHAEAQADFDRAIDLEETAVISSINSVHTPGVVRIQIGNIAPRTTDLQVTFMYTQELSIAYERFWKIHIPSTLTPRYYSPINAAREARNQRQQNVREEFKHGDSLTSVKGITTDNSKAYTWTIHARIDMNSRVNHHHCPTHDIETKHKNGKKTLELSLSQDEKQYPDRDFIFYFTTDSLRLENKYMTRYSENVNQYAACISIVPDLGTDPDDLMEALVSAEIPTQASYYYSKVISLKTDIYFVLDRSGSMEGKRIEKAIEALTTFIEALPSETKLNVISFGSNFSPLFNRCQRIDDGIKSQILAFLRNVKANMGCTELLPVINWIINQPSTESDGCKTIFVLTDGCIFKPKAIFNLLSQNINLRVFSLGIGSGCSEEHIRDLAFHGRGKCQFVNNESKIPKKLMQLLSDSLLPAFLVTKVEYDKSLIEYISPNPQSKTYIVQNDQLNFYILFKEGALNHTNSAKIKVELVRVGSGSRESIF
eukprot:TRINITY_DN3717_c0_g1_i15.p1 TRINITY_DN3717_c0_g1~~TRINITY_DN3717_c0_g1_i15.p1  ORF type:complete len:558 (-),score=82.86 TRINITY_DN3717_c0_g1_i15:789-2462(-)